MQYHAKQKQRDLPHGVVLFDGLNEVYSDCKEQEQIEIYSVRLLSRTRLYRII